MPKRAAPLTKRDLDQLRREAQADPSFQAKRADGGQAGLYVRARRGQVEFWHRARGPRRAETFIDAYGDITLDQARKAARDRRGIEAEGQDVGEVLAERKREGTTLGEAIDLYLGDLERRVETGARRGRKSTYLEFDRMLHRDELGSIRKLPVKTVTAAQVRRAHRRLADTPVAGNRTLTALSAAFRFAQAEGLVDENPCKYVERFEEKGSRRALTREELRQLGEEMHRTENDRIVLLVRLLALTGFRRGEVVGHAHRSRGGDALRWRDVDLKAGVVTLKDSKTGPQKRVIGKAAIDVLRSAKPKGAKPASYVIPGATKGQPYRSFNNTRRRLWKRAGLPLERGVDLHSLRHSFASIGAHIQDGRYAGVVGALLGHGHQAKAITKRYITDDPELLRPAADAISGEIARLLGLGERAEVVPIRPQRTGEARP